MNDIHAFVRTQPDYYSRQFERIGSSSRFTLTFNLWAGLLGSIWFGARGLWNWALPFLIIETLARKADLVFSGCQLFSKLHHIFVGLQLGIVFHHKIQSAKGATKC